MNYFIIIDAVTLILGIYIIFVSLRMKKSGKIESTFVAEDEMKKIKDTAGYIAYIYPKSLVFGIKMEEMCSAEYTLSVSQEMYSVHSVATVASSWRRP